MKKKVILLTALVAVMVALVGCGGSKSGKSSGGYEVALITDSGNIDDGSFNQGTWNGIEDYCKKNSITHGYYRPSNESKDAQIRSIKEAIKKGAKVIVTPGFSFAQTINDLQNDSTYDEIQFLLIDTVPQDAQGNDTTINKNVHCISYMEEQAGYLAGYAAVKDGLTKLGFLGGQSIPPVTRYGYGFVQGANDAAVEMNVANNVQVNFWYGGTFEASDDVYSKMDGWYSKGTEAVFACGGKIWQSATKAAEGSGKKVIGVDTDQAKDSQTIITSALKGISNSVSLALADLYGNGGKWPDALAGEHATLGAADDCVGLPTEDDSWRFTNFKVEDYNAIFAKIKSGEVTISNAVDTKPNVQITVNYEQ